MCLPESCRSSASPKVSFARNFGRLEPSEVLLPRALADSPEVAFAAPSALPRTVRDDWMFEEDIAAAELLKAYSVQSLDGFGFQSHDDALIRAGGASDSVSG